MGNATTDFRFSDWNPNRGTVPAYFVESGTDLIERGEVLIIDGAPCDAGGMALEDDGATRTLKGWRHSLCQSYNNGTVLVPLKGSRT